MDLNDVREGATVYLPVSQPGAPLYVGEDTRSRETGS